MAMSGFDIACWDALAVAAGKALVTLLGGALRRIRAYNSNGLGLMVPEAAAEEAEKLLEGGFRAVKLRLGHPTLAADLAALRAVRKKLPDAIELMSTSTRRCPLPKPGTRPRDRLRRHRLDRGTDPPRRLPRLRRTRRSSRRRCRSGRISRSPSRWRSARGGRVRLRDADLERIAGSPAGSAPRASPPSAQYRCPRIFFPEASAHLLAVTPTRHFLEYVDWAEAILAEPLAIEDGAAVIPDRPGTGVSWDEKAVKRYRMA